MKQPLTFNLKMCLQKSVKSFAENSKSVKSLVNCAALTPNNLINLNLAQISALSITQSNTTKTVADLFDISGEDTQNIFFENTGFDSVELTHIGANMTSGNITITGNAGIYCAIGLQGGTVQCLGNTADFAACNMANGLLKIEGNTGDFLGGATAGLHKGMRGGTAIVKGNAGDRVGDQMRRGLILIEGSVGDYCGSRMIAGTIGVLGNVGKYAGFSMQRGTLLLAKKPILHTTMQNCGTHTLPFLSLMLKSFKDYNTPFSRLNLSRVQRFVGDAATSGNGEILLITN